MPLPPDGLSAMSCTALACWWPQTLNFSETNGRNTRLGKNACHTVVFCCIPHFQFYTWDGSSSYSSLLPHSQKAAVRRIWWAGCWTLAERCGAMALQKGNAGTDILVELVTYLMKKSIAVHSCQQRRYFTKTPEDTIVDNYVVSVWKRRYLFNFR